MGVVGGVHSLHEIFGVSGTAPGSMYRMADGTYDAGKGNAGILRSLVGYWDECGKWASFCSSNAGGDCCWCCTFQEDNINSNGLLDARFE